MKWIVLVACLLFTSQARADRVDELNAWIDQECQRQRVVIAQIRHDQERIKVKLIEMERLQEEVNRLWEGFIQRMEVTRDLVERNTQHLENIYRGR